MRTILGIFTSAALLVVAACSTPAPDHTDSTAPVAVEQADHHGHDHDEASAMADNTIYGCPMHKEMIGGQGDRCPKCNYMEMIPVTWSLDGIDTVRVTSLPDYAPPQ
ncbi:MAG: hypothetical protein RBT71_01190 [Flavobacteriales bacterium]|jgi:hypothetical protein|nr:hypothetical protein [Flavobacteriales bacterium]